MSITKTIGRGEPNDIQVNEQDVSRQHARITFDGKEGLIVEDLDSLNFTYVNGYPIKKANATVNDEIRLSKNHIIEIRKIFGIPELIKKTKENPKDFTDEFYLLKDVLTNYKKKRKELLRKNTRKMALLRATVTITPLIIWLILKEIYIDNLEDIEEKSHWQSRYIYLSGLLIPIGNFFINDKNEIQERLEELDDTFIYTYVCPSCSRSLGKIKWETWELKGKCDGCQAIYSKSKL
jgi:hypothetical protein